MLGLISCSSKSTVQTKSIVPELLDRSEGIQLGKEWDHVQNSYMDLKTSIDQDQKNIQSLLELTALFIQEARVTGEHGHYYPAALALSDTVLNQKHITSDQQYTALVQKAGVQLSLHDFADALITGRKALMLNPQNAQVYGVLVDAYVELGQYQKAIVAADQMIRIKPDIRSYSRVSYLREIHGDIEGAISAMTMAIKSGFPGYEETAWAMLTLGELYQRYGQFDQAKKTYEEILNVRPDYPFAIAALADLKIQNGDLASAEQDLNVAINHIPEFGFNVQLAQIYKKQNREAEFKFIIEEIFAMLEDDIAAGHNMTMEYADIHLDLLDDPNQALTLASTEYNKRPDNIDVNMQMARIYRALNNTEMVQKHMADASITNSKHPDLASL